MDEADYRRVYDSAYKAGMRAGERRAAGRMVYRRQYWRCQSCGKVGMVLFRGDDDERMKQYRLNVAHEHRHCQTPHILRLTPHEAEKWSPRPS